MTRLVPLSKGLEPGELTHRIELAQLKKSFVKAGKTLKAVPLSELDSGARATLKASTAQARSTRLKGKALKPKNAADRPAQAAERFRGRSHAKRQADWVAAGSPRTKPTTRQTHTVKNPLITTPVLANAAGAAALSGAAGGYVHQRRKTLAKADTRDKKAMAAGAVAGAAGVEAAHVTAGQAGKRVAARARAKRWDKKVHQPVWDAHRKKHGIDEKVTGKTSNAAKQRMYLSYPKELPGWKTQRAIAFKNKPAVYGGLLAAGAAGGAAVAGRKVKKSLEPGELAHRLELAKAYGRAPAADALRWGAGVAGASGAGGGAVYLDSTKRKKLAESEGLKDAGAAVAGGLGGQAAYQGSVYAAKHKVLRDTHRAYAEKKSSKNKINEATKSNKKKFGMGTPDFYRNYPKGLPGWKTNRTLGHLARGKTGTAVGAVATVGAGAAALKARRQKKESK